MASKTPVSNGEGATPDAPALILFTSGTTGTPKGVLHTFRTLKAVFDRNRKIFSDETLAKTVCVLSTHFVAGLMSGSLTSLFRGGEVVLYPNPGVAGAGKFGELIDRRGITFFNSVPAFWKIVLKASRRPEKGTLRHVSVSASPLSRELWLKIGDWAGTKNVWNRYGTTETGGWDAGISAAEAEPEDGLVGWMVDGKAAILAEDGKISSTGEGEILLSTPTAMNGYFNRPELSAEAFLGEWFRTGDFGRIDGKGNIRLLGRTKTFINKAGIKLWPEEIDMVVEEAPGVAEACAFAVPDPVSGEAIGVAVVGATGVKPDPEALRAWCAARIRPEAIPDRWFVRDALPKNERGKINRDAVREVCLKGGR